MPTAVHDVQDRITRFLTEELERKNERMIVKIELEHAPAGCRAEQIKDWTREDNAEWFDLAYVERLAAEIVEMAEERADIYRGSENVFKVRAYQHIGTRKAYPFKMLPVHDGDESGIVGGIGSAPDGGHGATASGVLAMQMQNNQFIMRTNRDMMAGTIAVLTSQVKDLHDENKQLRAENRLLIAEANQNKAAEAERELAVVKQAHAEGRKDLFAGKAISLLPVMASSLLEKAKGTGAASDAMLPMVLSELGASLAANPQRMAAIGAALSVEERILLGKAMQLAKAVSEASSGKKPAPPASDAAPSSNGVHQEPPSAKQP